MAERVDITPQVRSGIDELAAAAIRARRDKRASQEITDGCAEFGDSLASMTYAKALTVVATYALVRGRSDIGDRILELAGYISRMPDAPRRRSSHG